MVNEREIFHLVNPNNGLILGYKAVFGIMMIYLSDRGVGLKRQLQDRKRQLGNIYTLTEQQKLDLSREMHLFVHLGVVGR